MSAGAGGARQRQVLEQLGLVRYRVRGAAAGLGGSAGQAALDVSAPGSRAAPVAGAPAQVWVHVLAWLGLEPGQVHWREQGGRSLPPVADWTGPDGKRGLWLALKGWRRPAG